MGATDFGALTKTMQTDWAADLQRAASPQLSNVQMQAMIGDASTAVDTQDLRIAELEQMIHQMQREQATPFDETEDFRDFVVWLCGFTDREDVPEQKDWDVMVDRVKHMAAKFALQTRDRDRQKLRDRAAEEQMELQYWQKAQQVQQQKNMAANAQLAQSQAQAATHAAQYKVSMAAYEPPQKKNFIQKLLP